MKHWLFILFVFHPGAWAALKWERLQAELTPKANEPHVETTFGFVNNGKTPVVIESLKSSCSCLTAELEKRTYAPGEQGQVKARFEIGQRRGKQGKVISVKIQGDPVPEVLTVTVIIPELVKATPEVLIWEFGEIKKPKEIAVTCQPGQTILGLEVTSNDPRMQAKVESMNGSHLVRVVPQDEPFAGLAVLKIEVKLVNETKTIHAYAQVRPAAK